MIGRYEKTHFLMIERAPRAFPVILDPAGRGVPLAHWYEPHGSLSEAAVVATDERFCWRPAEPLPGAGIEL